MHVCKPHQHWWMELKGNESYATGRWLVFPGYDVKVIIFFLVGITDGDREGSNNRNYCLIGESEERVESGELKVEN